MAQRLAQRRVMVQDGTRDGLGSARMVQRRAMAKDGTKDGLGSTRKSREGPWPIGWYKGWSKVGPWPRMAQRIV
jgi:hypothetical protein